MFEGRIQRSFEAMNRKDLDGVMRWWADDGVFEFPGHSVISGRHEGKPAIRAFFGRVFERMATMHLTAKRVAFTNPIGLNYAGAMMVEYEVDETTVEGRQIHNEAVAVYAFRRGKLAYAREYFFDSALVDEIWGRADGQPTARSAA